MKSQIELSQEKLNKLLTPETRKDPQPELTEIDNPKKLQLEQANLMGSLPTKMNTTSLDFNQYPIELWSN